MRRIACLLAVLLTLSACSSPEARGKRFLEAGKLKFQKKDFSRAMLDFRAAAQALPKSPEPYYQLGLVNLAIGDVRNGYAMLKKAADLDPKHVEARVKMAELLSGSGNKEVLEEAEKQAHSALALSPDRPEARVALAMAELKLGNLESAEQELTETLKKAPAYLGASVSLAKLRLAQKDLPGAEAALKDAVAKSKDSALAHLALGTFYLRLNRLAEAETEIRRAAELDPNNPSVLMNLAVIQAGTGRKSDAGQTYQKVSKLQDPRYRAVYGAFLLADRQLEAATREFERLAKENPRERAIRTQLVGIYLSAGKREEARKLLAAALKSNPKDIEARIQRDDIWIQDGKVEEAHQDLLALLRETPDSPQVRYLLSKTHGLRGDRGLQKQELGEALRVSPGFLIARLDLARILLDEKAAKAVLALLDGAVPAQQGTLGVRVARNWAHLISGDFAAVRKGIDEALRVASSPELRLQDALLRLSQKDLTGARSNLESLLQANPEDVRALEFLAGSYVAEGKRDAALAKVREHAGRHPSSARLQYVLGNWGLRMGQRSEARAAFEAVKKLSGGSVAADLALAQLDIAEGKLQPARQAALALSFRNPRNAAAWYLLAKVDELEQNHPAAIANYRKVMEIDPLNVAAMNNLAYLLLEFGGQPDEGLKHAMRAAELAPNDAAVADTVGWAWYRKGSHPQAVKDLERAVSLQPTPRRTYHLAMAYLKAGDRKRGLATLEKAVKSDPNLPEAEMARKLLAER
ncbi:MAG: tetratricopeptide repeat protein [Acidobacteria bacterium]|nr:tetratricopeptide repeat protein [Acidobacteriota bacterium]